MAQTMGNKLTSSSASTGGAGTFFEQHVDAFFLALLAVRGIPPIFTKCRVVELHLQTEVHGLNTDGVLLVCESGTGSRRKILCQVKRTFSVSATDSECCKAIIDFWKDFRESPEFSVDHDAFAVITLRGTDVLLRHFGGLLEFSRHCRDVAEFEQRIAAKGVLHKTSKRYANEIRTIIEEHEQKSITTDELFRFVRLMHIVSLDLNTTTLQSESMIKSLLAISVKGQDPVGAADASWSELLREVTAGMPNAKSYCRADLPLTILDRHVALPGKHEHALQRLSEHSELVLNGTGASLAAQICFGPIHRTHFPVTARRGVHTVLCGDSLIAEQNHLGTEV